MWQKKRWDREGKWRHFFYKIQKSLKDTWVDSRHRREDTVILGLRLRHCELNKTLKMVGKHQTGLCEGCREEESVEHFPDPKSLLHNTISRSVGTADLSRLIQYSCTEQSGVKKVTVTLHWPYKIEEEGHAFKKLDAERFAAAAACLKLKVSCKDIRQTADGRTGGLHSALCDEDDILTDDFNTPTKEEVSQISEALSLFPQPKDLLHRVVQLATSNRVKEVVQFKTRRGISELTLHWPEKMTFSAKAKKGVTAEKMVAALACMKLKELKLLDDNNKPLNHVKYHQEKVKELANQQKRPVPLEIPDHLLESIKEYHTQYPVEAEVQKVWDEEEVREQQTVNEEEDEDLVKDAITGKLYRPLSEREAQQLSAHLQEEWETANPVLSVKLPADAHRQQVVSAVQSSRVVVIAGETGCGKTTRIPRFLLEECVRSGNGAECNILVTQPRRISAVSVAQRVAQEMGPDLKHSVGYQVRLESKAPEHSGGTMLFVTVGILLRKMQSNPSLKGISHVVVDEVHERDINTDLLLALLRSSLEKNPNLRVVLMSATGDKRRLAEYFGGCPVVEVPGFMHPVRDRYLEDVLKELGHQLPVRRHDIATDLKLVADVIEHIDRHGEPGAVLCFLPGWQDIRAVQEELMERPRFSSGSQIILSLHSSLSVQDQQVVFQRPQVGQRKIVLATNIAETSITIDDIVHVVDTGTHKEQTYDPLTKVSCLDTVWISRSNVTQRKGRAGRCQPGHSYHLFPRKQLETMAHFAIPEILRTPLENLVMQAKIHSPNCKTVDFLSQVLDSPELEAVKVAVQNLEDIGVLDKMENLTPLGKSVSYMSCDPRLGKLLVLGVMYRCALPMLSVAACLTRDPFYNSLLNRAQILKVKALSDSGYSDYLAFIRAVSGWRKVQQEGARADRENYLHKHTLSGSSLRFINGLIYQFSSNLQEAQLVSHAHQCLQDTSVLNEHSNQDELLKAVLLAGFYPNLIQVKKGGVAKGRFRPNSVCFHTVTGPVQLNRTVNSRRKEFPSRWLTFFSAVKSSGVVFIRDSSVVHPLALLLFTDCDILETVKGDKVVLSLPGHTLVHCELSVETWDLLWDLRTSMQTMLYRNFSNPSNAIIHSAQDKKLISLLVELLNNTNSSPFIQNDSDSEVD
uniref:RNA helicase n=1 Tax=Dicentrarchus labrax TaxID=13489 RepID=A0A8C4I221_DICLA